MPDDVPTAWELVRAALRSMGARLAEGLSGALAPQCPRCRRAMTLGKEELAPGAGAGWSLSAQCQPCALAVVALASTRGAVQIVPMPIVEALGDHAAQVRGRRGQLFRCGCGCDAAYTESDPDALRGVRLGHGLCLGCGATATTVLEDGARLSAARLQ